MLTLGTILRATDPEILRQSGKYRAETYKMENTKDERGEHVRILGVVTGGREPRTAVVRCYDKTVSISSQCMVSCSCDMFKYKLEIALAARGSAKQVHSDPNLPMRTNPHMLPGLCPHLAYIVKVALSATTTRKSVVKQTTSPKPKKK